MRIAHLHTEMSALQLSTFFLISWTAFILYVQFAYLLRAAVSTCYKCVARWPRPQNSEISTRNNEHVNVTKMEELLQAAICYRSTKTLSEYGIYCASCQKCTGLQYYLRDVRTCTERMERDVESDLQSCEFVRFCVQFVRWGSEWARKWGHVPAVMGWTERMWLDTYLILTTAFDKVIRQKVGQILIDKRVSAKFGR